MPLSSQLYNRVAFVGKMGAGKSHTAKWLRDTFDFKIFSFATGLKQAAQEYYEMDPENKDRQLLQTLGDAMRSVDINVFARRCVNEVAQHEDNHRERVGVVIDDLRFENELQALREMPGPRWIIIKIRPHEAVRFLDAAPLEQLTQHQSENEWTRFRVDYEIESGDTSNLQEILREANQRCSIA